MLLQPLLHREARIARIDIEGRIAGPHELRHARAGLGVRYANSPDKQSCKQETADRVSRTDQDHFGVSPLVALNGGRDGLLRFARSKAQKDTLEAFVSWMRCGARTEHAAPMGLKASLLKSGS